MILWKSAIIFLMGKDDSERNVVAEEMKRRFNMGEEAVVFFYRNASGTIEVDLLVELDGKLHPLEIKASSPFSFPRSMTKNLKAFGELCPEAETGRVVYSDETMPVAVNFADTDKWCI